MCVVALKLLKTDCPLRYTTLAPFVKSAKRPGRLLGVEAHDCSAPYTYRHGRTTNVYIELVFQDPEASRPHTVLLGYLDHVPWIDTDKIKELHDEFAVFLPMGRPLTTLPPRKHLLLPPHPPYRVTVTFLETPPGGRMVTWLMSDPRLNIDFKKGLLGPVTPKSKKVGILQLEIISIFSFVGLTVLSYFGVCSMWPRGLESSA